MWVSPWSLYCLCPSCFYSCCFFCNLSFPPILPPSFILFPLHSTLHLSFSTSFWFQLPIHSQFFSIFLRYKGSKLYVKRKQTSHHNVQPYYTWWLLAKGGKKEEKNSSTLLFQLECLFLWAKGGAMFPPQGSRFEVEAVVCSYVTEKNTLAMSVVAAFGCRLYWSSSMCTTGAHCWCNLVQNAVGNCESPFTTGFPHWSYKAVEGWMSFTDHLLFLQLLN